MALSLTCGFILPMWITQKVTGADCFRVIEISDTTLRWDMGRKAIRYALGGVREYWVIDVDGRQTFVHRL
jgi:Uma2 family endonuclease